MSTDEKSEAAETARHYGNMRFSMFTVFTTISGALLAFPFLSGGSAFVHASPLNLHALCFVGVLTSVLFTLAQYRISHLVVFYQEHAHDLNALPLPLEHHFWKWMILLAMLVPSAVTLSFWALLYLEVLVLPVFGGG